MARRPRLTLPNVPLHLIQRGNNRQACFFADEDYRFYLAWLAEHASKCGCRIHAYVLMTNHVHLLLSADIGHKYLGFRNYRDLRGHVLGANAVWTPIAGALCVFLVVEFGWRDAIWVLAVPGGYALSFWRFLKKPQKAWDDEKLPTWPS